MADATALPHGEVSRGSTVIAAFSTIVEWYDFTLYLYFATVLSRVFFGGGTQSLLTTLAGFAIAYLMRPLGAIFFGHVGDRFAHGAADTRPDCRSATGLDPQKLTEHSPTKPRSESHDRAGIRRDVPAERELHQMAVGPMLTNAPAFAGRGTRWTNRVKPLCTGRDGSLRGAWIVGYALDVVARSVLSQR